MSISGRSRKKIIIKSDAKTKEEKCGTLIKSSKDMQEKYNLKVVYIFHSDNIELADKGKSTAIGSYAPDGNGNSLDNWTWELQFLDSDSNLQNCLPKK